MDEEEKQENTSQFGNKLKPSKWVLIKNYMLVSDWMQGMTITFPKEIALKQIKCKVIIYVIIVRIFLFIQNSFL